MEGYKIDNFNARKVFSTQTEMKIVSQNLGESLDNLSPPISRFILAQTGK